jgi:hypothetical protein
MKTPCGVTAKAGIFPEAANRVENESPSLLAIGCDDCAGQSPRGFRRITYLLITAIFSSMFDIRNVRTD